MRYMVKWKKVKRKEDGEAGRVRSWKALWSMLMEFIFTTLGSCWRTSSRTAIGWDVHFKNTPLADGKEGGLWGDQEKEIFDRSLAVSQVAGAMLICYSENKQEDSRNGQVWKTFRKYSSQHLVTEWMCRVREGRTQPDAHVSHADSRTADGEHCLSLRPGTQEEQILAWGCAWWLWYDE